MSKYVIHFSKEGIIKYTSHLDMLRLFKRAFKRTGIQMVYSKGFNPHPKIGFAQPLSLGYTSKCELLEFETADDWQPEEIRDKIASAMPDGIEIFSCRPFTENVKSLAAATEEAEYLAVFPVDRNQQPFDKILKEYLMQPQILSQKRQKKTKKLVDVDIRPKIRGIEITDCPKLTLSMKLDCGSVSNLSPEQVITSFLQFAELDIPRYDIEVERRSLVFDIPREI